VDQVVATNERDVPVIQIEVRAYNEDVTMAQLTLRSSGTLNDREGITGVKLFLDRNEDGRIDPNDAEVAQPARASADDGAVTFAPLAERIVRNGRAVYLAVVDLSGRGSAGQSMTLALATDADVTALGSVSGAIAAVGAPLRGVKITLVGALNVRIGQASPPGLGVLASTTFPALQLELFTRGEAVTIDQLSLRLSGTAEDNKAIAQSQIWLDVDGDGVTGGADEILATATGAENDGLLAYQGLELKLAENASARVLVNLTLSEDAAAGGTIRLHLEANEHVTARGERSGMLTAVGAPIEGAAFTIIEALPSMAEPDEGCSCRAGTPIRTSGTESASWIALGALVSVLLRTRRRRCSF
jgi:hypothetical protein